MKADGTSRGARVLFMAAGLLILAGGADVRGQQSTVPPTVDEARVQIERGRDIVQVPSLWYQEGDAPPDSLGVLRVARPPEDPDAVTYPDARYRFPVNLQVATFIRDEQVAEVPISRAVIEGRVEGRIIIRPPAEDAYDIAEPLFVDPIRQVPGEETVIDAQAWYEAALLNPLTGRKAPATRYQTTRELRGRLRSTAPGGESVFFVIPASVQERPSRAAITALAPRPLRMPMRMVIPAAKITLAVRRPGGPALEWRTRVAFLSGASRADIPGRFGTYEAYRASGEAATSLRWHVSPGETYGVEVFGATHATFSASGSHNDVPYGASLFARFGAQRAFVLQVTGVYQDDPFQAQSFGAGDERLRLVAGIDQQQPALSWAVRLGPTYLRDRPSSWEQARSDARELGVRLGAEFARRFRPEPFLPITLSGRLGIDQSWGYIRDAGTSNTTIAARMSLKFNVTEGTMRTAVGPVGRLFYKRSDYKAIPGFDELNAQLGVEAVTTFLF